MRRDGNGTYLSLSLPPSSRSSSSPPTHSRMTVLSSSLPVSWVPRTGEEEPRVRDDGSGLRGVRRLHRGQIDLSTSLRTAKSRRGSRRKPREERVERYSRLACSPSFTMPAAFIVLIQMSSYSVSVSSTALTRRSTASCLFILGVCGSWASGESAGRSLKELLRF
jgi:hypothetical protein